MAYVYRHIRLDKNEPFYIGIGSDTHYTRAYEKGNRRNKIWKDIVAKSEYKVDILIDDLTWEEACEKEKEFISLYGRISNETGTLSNMTDGGDGIFGYNHSVQSKIKMSNKKIGIKRSDDLKNKLSLARKGKYTGKDNWFYGKNHSIETKLKMSEMKSNGKSVSAKIVLDMTTGIYYSCVREASEAFGLNYGTLINKLNGNKKNNTNLIYA
jgi:hypothetical protein